MTDNKPTKKELQQAEQIAVEKFGVKKKENIKSFLQEGRKKYASLGCGYHNGVYYFGTKLFKDYRQFDAVITSNKKCYINKRFKIDKDKWVGEDEIRGRFGLSYKEQFYDESLDNIFSKEAINQWLFGDTKNITIKSVYEKIVNLVKTSVFLDDKRKYSLLACYRIAGFFMPIWQVRARLFSHADPGAAKSRLTQILHNIGFNSVSLGDWTLAYLKTIIESTRGETHIDDFETLPEELANASKRLVKVGYMRGFKAGKMSEGGSRKPEVNDLFNTTTLNNVQGLDFITNDRCITIRIPKISNKKYDKEPNFDEPIWKEIRDELYILGLKYPNKVKETYDTIKSDKIGGRLFSIIKPELAIAKLVSDEVYQDIEDFWLDEIEQRENVDFETDWEFLTYKEITHIIYKTLSPNTPYTLHTLLSPLAPNIEFKLYEDIVKKIGVELYGDKFSDKKRSMSIVIGNYLSRNPIFKKRILSGKKVYSVQINEFKGLLEAKRYMNPIKQILDIKEEKKEEKKVIEEGDIGVTGDRGKSKKGVGGNPENGYKCIVEEQVV